MDASGSVLRSLSAPSAAAAINAATLSSQEFDPYTQALTVSEGNWSLSFDGKDNDGHFLQNGSYVLVIESGGTEQRLPFSVRSRPRPLDRFGAAPNPGKLGSSMQLFWSPSQPMEAKIYSSAGDLVRSFDSGPAPPLLWDLKLSSGEAVSPGIYLLFLRSPGERNGRLFKLAITR